MQSAKDFIEPLSSCAFTIGLCVVSAIYTFLVFFLEGAELD
jgi:hypothetical protein